MSPQKRTEYPRYSIFKTQELLFIAAVSEANGGGFNIFMAAGSNPFNSFP